MLLRSIHEKGLIQNYGHLLSLAFGGYFQKQGNCPRVPLRWFADVHHGAWGNNCKNVKVHLHTWG